MPRMSGLFSRPLLIFGLVVAVGIGVWATATVLIEPDPTFVSEKRCAEDSGFNCVTIRVPRDHAAPEGETWEVTFAIQRALSGSSEGVIAYAVGGPGASGIAVADDYASYFDRAVPDRYDLVFFDQRGIGRSQPLQCPNATLTWNTTPESPTGSSTEAEAFGAATERYVADCVAETGVPAEDLPLYATAQAIEDLEVFRQWHGAEQLIVFGESYGTQYAQAYAAAHPDRVKGLIIDGPIDMTLSGTEYYLETAETADEVLALILDACDEDPACAEDMDGNDALDVYDALAAELRDGPMSFNFVTANGEEERREFTLNDLDTAVNYVLTPTTDRMFLQRGIAQAGRGEILPLARLLYAALAQDPETLDAVPDPTWSDAMYYAVDCGDYAFGSGSADERAEEYFAAGEAAGVADMRLGSGYFLDLPCAYWPTHPPDERPPYLGDTPFPVLILGATWDPYTPYPNAQRLADNLGNAYAITQLGGPHVIGLRGEPCPDDYLTAYLLDGELPASREIECDFIGVEPYVPIPAASVDDYGSTLEALSAVDDEINNSPDWWYWDGTAPLSVGCLYGGHVTYVATETAAGDELTYKRTANGERSATGDLP
jgi:pimeloyl-ACP methyl ester carboxylesterase